MDFWMFWDMVPLVIRKVLLGIIGPLALIGLPVGGYVIGVDIVNWNVEGRSPGRSAADARAAQWDWPLWLPVGGLVVGFIIFILCMLYIFAAQGDKRSVWR